MEVRLTIITGSAEQQQLCLKKKRIHLGRLAEVIDADGRSHEKMTWHSGTTGRLPTIRFASSCHIEFDPEKAVFRLFDDRSAHGTTVIRDGSVIPVPQGRAKASLCSTGMKSCLDRRASALKRAVPNSLPISELFSLTRADVQL